MRFRLFLGTVGLIAFTTTIQAATVKPAYETEIWEAGRSLVWAHPGQDGALSDPNQWRHTDGRSAKEAPDRHTDILLPAAEALYKVQGHRTDQVRHVTVEKNGMLLGRHRDEVEIWGNAHLKDGGFAYYVSVCGDKHTFFKLDQSEFPTPENEKVVHHTSRHMDPERRCRGHIAHKFQVCKYGTASVELIGKFGISDEIMVQHGRMIVSDELRYSGATGKGALEVFDGGILEVQSGACVAPFTADNRKCVYNVNIYRNGTLQAGSPQRPLTSDARLLLGYATQDQPGRSGLYTAVGSMMRVYTTDPKTARLVISATSSDPTFFDGQGERVGDPDQAAQGNSGIALQLAGDMPLSGVHFDYVCEGGIGVIGAEQPADWTDVTWGSHNAAAPGSLFSALAAKADVYYHPRSDQRSEYGLTVRAVAQMKEHLKKTDPFGIQTLPPSVQNPNSTGDSKPVLRVTTTTPTQAGKTSLFSPEEDVFLQNSGPVNNEHLRIRAGTRTAYLKFNLSGLSGDIQGATLKLTESGDPGNGNLRIYRGSHNHWTEADITAANAPDKDGEIGNHSGLVDAGQTIEIDVSPLITENGVCSFVIEMDPGGNDVSFGSKENKNKDYMMSRESLVFHEPIDVSIQTRVPGAKIRYTLDGSEPVKSSPVYSGPIRLVKTTRITAKAYKPGMGFSPVFSTTYIIER